MTLAAPLRPAPRPALVSTACGPLAALMLVSLIIGQIGIVHEPHFDILNDIAGACAIAIAALRIGEVRRIPRLFAIGALVAVLAVGVAAPDALPEMRRALLQGTAFSAFLIALGLIRAPVRASRIVGRAAARLFGYPPGRRRAAILYGTQFLSILFNIGTIGIMTDIARDHSARARAEGMTPLNSDAVILGAMQGTTLITIWNPIGIGFAVVASTIPALDPARFLLLSFLATVLATAAILAGGPGTAVTDPEARATTGGNRALAAILAAVIGLIGATLLLHWSLGIGFIVAACIIVPLLAFLWPIVEPAARTPRGPLAAMSEASATMASESTIFFAAAIISAGIAVALRHLGIDALIGAGAVPALAIILACLLVIPAAAALMIPHSIVMVMAAQILGPSPIGTEHPLSLALALCFAWAMAIAASPISAISIMTARSLGITPARLAFTINRGFALTGLLAGGAMICLLYNLE